MFRGKLLVSGRVNSLLKVAQIYTQPPKKSVEVGRVAGFIIKILIMLHLTPKNPGIKPLFLGGGGNVRVG